MAKGYKSFKLGILDVIRAIGRTLCIALRAIERSLRHSGWLLLTIVLLLSFQEEARNFFNVTLMRIERGTGFSLGLFHLDSVPIAPQIPLTDTAQHVTFPSKEAKKVYTKEYENEREGYYGEKFHRVGLIHSV